MGGILQALANYNPTGFALGNQQRQATLGETIARTAQTRAATAGTEAQTQATQLANQIQLRTLQDQDATMKAWRDIDPNADPATQEHQLITGTIKNGGSPKAVTDLQLHFADVRMKNATATADEMKNRQQQRDEDAGVLNSIINGPDEEKQFQWAKAIPSIQRHLDPGETLPPEYPGDDAARAGMNHLLYLSAQTKIAKEQAETGKAQAETAATTQKAQLEKDQADREAYARAHPEDAAAQQAALTGKERTDFQLKQLEFGLQRDKLNEELRHNRTNEGLRAQTNAIQGGRLAQEQYVNGIKYGPDSIDYWVKTLEDNPDAIKLVPGDIRGTLNKAWQTKTGLPLPNALEGQLKQNETNAGTALDNISRIRQLVTDPEIQQRLGPILGRLGNVEQRVGAAVGLSPQAEEKAQELRTLMRYFVFQEGKTILGGRLPRQLMQQLESSSASPSMDAPTLAGALNGAEGQANTVRDNAERARFGGKMRLPEMRPGIGRRLPQGGGRVIDRATAEKFYQAAGNDPVKGRELATANGWKLQ